MASSRSLAVDRGTPQGRARLAYRYVLQLAVVFVLYLGVGKLGLAIPFTSSNVSPIWPAAGIAVAAVPNHRARCVHRATKFALCQTACRLYIANVL